MKLTCRWLCVLMAIMMLLTVPAYAETSAVTPLDIAMASTAYEQMKKHYSSFEYNEARQLILDNPLMIDHPIQDARLYKAFLDGVFYMEQGEFQNAQLSFGNAARNDQNGILHNPASLYYYCLGRHHEEREEYAEAISAYSQTLYGDSDARAQTCCAKADQAIAKAEEEKLQKARAEKETKLSQASQYLALGQRRNDLDMLYKALTIYMELGETAPAAQCMSAIETAEKVELYNAASEQFISAKATGNIQAMEDAALTFIELGSYSDSAAKAQEILDYLDILTRELKITVKDQQPTSIDLSWTDSNAQASAYTITWKPLNAPHAPQTTSVSYAHEITLSGLIPNTTYEISISPADLPTLLQTAQIKTAAAPRHANSPASIMLFDVYGYARHRLKAGERPRDAFMMYQSNLAIDYVSAEGKLILEPYAASLQPKTYVYHILHGVSGIFTEPATYQWILRTQKSGVYAAPAYEDQSIALCFFCDDLEILLDQVYEACGEWPGEACQLELYVDDAYVLAVPLIISSN